MTDLKKDIISILVSEFGMEENQVLSDNSLDDMGADSIVIIELKLELERLLGYKLQDEDVVKDSTLTKLMKVVEGKEAVNV